MKKINKKTLTFPNGAKYVGEFKNDKWHGQGTYSYANGDKYVGEFKDGKRNGQGTYTYADGDYCTGKFNNEKCLGKTVKLDRTLAKWLASWNSGKVRVNVVSPGGVYNSHNKKFLKSYSSKTLIGRMATQEEIFGIFKYLISDSASYVTGQNFIIDGGYTSL